MSTKHGLTDTRTHRIWRAMKTRCTNPNAINYPHYGGRGIRVCERWASSFENFLADMGECPPDLTIERVDGNRGYEPGNCVWATREEQNRNTTRNHRITVFGETKTISEWGHDPRARVSDKAINSRLSRGWSAERAVTEPLSKQRKGSALALLPDVARLHAAGLTAVRIARELGIHKSSVNRFVSQLRAETNFPKRRASSRQCNTAARKTAPIPAVGAGRTA